jgi:hypothetical protein
MTSKIDCYDNEVHDRICMYENAMINFKYFEKFDRPNNVPPGNTPRLVQRVLKVQILKVCTDLCRNVLHVLSQA